MNYLTDHKLIYLIHGWGTSPIVWKPFFHLLQLNHFDPVLVDFSCPKINSFNNYHWDEICDAIFKEKGINKKGIWLGWSLGGLLALHIAKRQPQLVEHIFLMASTPKFVSSENWQFAIPQDSFNHFYSELTNNTHKTWENFIDWHVTHKDKHTTQILKEELKKTKPSADWLKYCMKLLETSDTQYFEHLSLPITCILGELDALLPYSCSHQLKEIWPHVSIKNCKRAHHAPFLQAPEESLNFIKNSLNENEEIN